MRPNLSELTSQSIRRFLRQHPYQHYGSTPNTVEYMFLNTITQVDMFYTLCDSTPPTQEEFVKRYSRLCKREIVGKGANFNGLRHRIARAWATLMSEAEFYCQARDCNLFDEVIIDTVLDCEAGYDIGVVIGEDTFYIHLYYCKTTEAADKWGETKGKRKEKLTSLGLPEALEFPLTDKDADFVGNIHLYTSANLKKLKEMLSDAEGMPAVDNVLHLLERRKDMGDTKDDGDQESPLSDFM